jgi:small subunit ribosomal protein S16
MVIIRLSRSGSKQKTYYNVVVQESRKRRDGRFIERVGFYNPMAQSGAETIRIDAERIAYWKSHGAQISETMSRIIKLQAKGPAGLEVMKQKDAKKAEAKKAKKEAEKVASVEPVVEEGAAPAAEATAPTEAASVEPVVEEGAAPAAEATAPTEAASAEPVVEEAAAPAAEATAPTEAASAEPVVEEAAAPAEEAPKEE